MTIDSGSRRVALGRRLCVDGNEAAARVAYALSEVIADLPDHPGVADGRARRRLGRRAAGRTCGASVPEVVEMQSEAGAAGALHGALQRGALATTFTASQGLLLMIPNMFKIAGELTPAVIHVAARTVATHALSIFGDHSDVMHARTTGWAMLAAGSRAGGARLRAGRPRRHACARGCRSCTSSTGSARRHEIDKIAAARRRRPAGAGRRRRRARPPVARPDARRAGAAGHGPEPRRVLPGPGGGQPLLRRRPGHRAGRHGRARRRAPAGATGSSSTSARPTPSGSSCSWARAPARPRRRSTPSSPRASAVGLLKVRLYRPFPADAAGGRAAPDACGRSPCSTAPRSRAPRASRCYLDVVAALDEAWTRDAPPFAARAPGDRRPLRPGVEGVHPGDGQGRLRRARRSRGRGRSGSFTVGHLRRRHPPQPRRRPRLPAPRGPRARCRPCSSGSAPTARWAPTRRR